MSEKDPKVALPADYEQAVDRPTPGPWYAVFDADMGDWAICNTTAPPSRHDPEKGHKHVGSMTRRADAQLVAMLRNLVDADLQRQEEQRQKAGG